MNNYSSPSLEALPVIPLSQRAELAGRPQAEHGQLLKEQVFAKTTEVQPTPEPQMLGRSARVIAWNAERGGHVKESAELLAGLDADIILLGEMDCGMARSGQRHTVAELAAELGGGYVYGVEFLELTLGNHKEAARLKDQQNDVGYHGNAIISRAEIKRPALVRLETSGLWFANIANQIRIGGRMAVLATIELGGQAVAFASVHLENRASPQQRAEHFKVLLDYLEMYAPGLPAVIGGDLNTFSYDLHANENDIEALRQLFKEDPGRLLNPVPYEPLFELAGRHGFEWQSCNRLNESTQRLVDKPLSLTGIKKLDWLLVKGLQSSEAQIIGATPPDIAVALSDHELVSAKVSTGRGA